MASYKYIRHTAAEIDEAIEQEREHCANEASHTCQEEKDRWNGAAELAETNKSDILKAKNDIAINRVALGTQCKNLLSVNDGTATRFIDKIINQIEPGKYILSIGELTSTDADSSICLCLFTDNNNTQLSNNIHLKRGTNISATVTINKPVTKIRIYASNDWINSDGDTVTASNIMLRPADITDDTYESYKSSVNERLVEVENDVSSLEQHKMGYEYGYAYAKNDTNVGWFKVASFSCPAIGSTLRRATFFVTGVSGSNTGMLSVQATSVTGTTPGIGAITCSWAYNQLTTSGGKYITNIPIDSFKAIGNLDGNMIRVELWCRIDNAYFVLKSRLLNFESRTDFLPVSEVEMYSSSTATTEEPTGAINTISSYNLRKELDDLTARITALENK